MVEPVHRIKDLRAVAMQSAGQLAANTQLIELPLQRGELVWRGRGTAIIFRQPRPKKSLSTVQMPCST